MGKALETTNHLPNCKVGANNPRACILSGTEASSTSSSSGVRSNSSSSKQQDDSSSGYASNDAPKPDQTKKTIDQDTTQTSEDEASVAISDKQSLIGDAKNSKKMPINMVESAAAVIGHALQTASNLCSPTGNNSVVDTLLNGDRPLTCSQCKQVLPESRPINQVQDRHGDQGHEDYDDIGRSRSIDQCYAGSCSEECYSYSGSGCSCMGSCDQQSSQPYGCEELGFRVKDSCCDSISSCRGYMTHSASAGRITYDNTGRHDLTQLHHGNKSVHHHASHQHSLEGGAAEVEGGGNDSAKMISKTVGSNHRIISNSVETIPLEMCQDIPDVLI